MPCGYSRWLNNETLFAILLRTVLPPGAFPFIFGPVVIAFSLFVIYFGTFALLQFLVEQPTDDAAVIYCPTTIRT